MKLENVLTKASVIMNLESNNKEDIIKELVEHLAKDNKISDVDLALKDVLEREKKMSTGIQYGVAIPHGKSKEVKDLIACIGLKKEGVDFDSLDKKPSNIFILTLSPHNRLGPHMQFLAQISNVLKSKSAREEILKSENEEQVLKVFGL